MWSCTAMHTKSGVFCRAILHDENTYPDPMPFNPDRFLRPDGKLDETVKDPATASFGFGRRLCVCIPFCPLWTQHMD